MAEPVWGETSISECPGCGATTVVHILSLAAACPCGFYYVDLDGRRGWYSSREAYQRGDPKIGLHVVMSIQCPRCHARSYHPGDVANRYCGRCHMFHDQMKSVPSEV